MHENYYKKFIHFLKEHNLYDENAMEYLHEKGIFFNYLEEENRDFIGCYFAINKRKILEDIILCVPYIRDEKTLIINVHEYTHALLYYKYLGKKVDTKNSSIEILPMMYEKLYIKESNSQLGKEYIEYLDSQITEKSDLKYRIAIEAQQDILDFYGKEKNPDKLQDQSKKIAKKLTKKLAK